MESNSLSETNSKENLTKGSLTRGIFLVAGTAIGGGMLALPVLTSPGGFLPAALIYFLCWLFMVCTGILLMEVVLWHRKEANIISMAEMTLGKWGKYFAWALYLFFFYSLSVAYVAGGGGLMNELFENLAQKPLAPSFGPLIFVLLFAPFVAISAEATSRINLVLMGGLLFSFLIFVILGASHVETHFLTRSNFALALFATPVAFTAFGFQGIVPSLTHYLGRDPKRMIVVILLGTSLPFLIYLVWEWLILGVIPKEALDEALTLGQSAVFPLKKVLNVPWLFRVGEFFAFFAIVTSFLGVALGLFDFLSDGLKIKKNIKGKSLLSCFVFLPPLVFSMINPHVFLNALHYAGGFGSALLLGLLPLLMAWRGRYRLGFKSELPLPGGKLFLCLLMLFIVFELVIMLWKIG